MTTTTYPANRTALLIVDPYNDFMSEGGKLYEATRKTAEAVGLYEQQHAKGRFLRFEPPASKSSSCRIIAGEKATIYWANGCANLMCWWWSCDSYRCRLTYIKAEYPLWKSHDGSEV